MRQLTDAGGTVTRAAAYSPYGEALYAAGSAQTAYGFTNEYTDAAGLTYLRARHYSAAMGRFMTRDTWEGDVNRPMSYNAWLYGYASPVVFVDRTGLAPGNPCEGIPYGGGHDACNSAASIPPHVAGNITQHNQFSNPWNITYVGQNLPGVKIDGSLNDLQQQLIWNSSEPDWPRAPNTGNDLCPDLYHCGLCGLVSVAAILNKVYPGGIKANDVVDDFIDYNEYYNTPRYQIGNYPDHQRMDQLYDFVKKSYFSYLYAHEAEKPNSTILPAQLASLLSMGSYAIVGVNAGHSTGKINADGGYHWVVVTGISYRWDSNNWESPWNWVRIYNSFTNQTEYYPWKFFKPAYDKGHKNMMRVDTRSRRYTEGLLEFGLGCVVPPYVLERVR